MTMNVAGRFTTFDDAPGGARYLHERASGQDKAPCPMRLTPAAVTQGGVQ